MPVELTDYAKKRRHAALSTGELQPSNRKISKGSPRKKASMKSNIKAHKDGAAAAREAADRALKITRR